MCIYCRSRKQLRQMLSWEAGYVLAHHSLSSMVTKKLFYLTHINQKNSSSCLAFFFVIRFEDEQLTARELPSCLLMFRVLFFKLLAKVKMLLSLGKNNLLQCVLSVCNICMKNECFSGTWGYGITFSNWNIQVNVWMDKMGLACYSLEYVTMLPTHTPLFSPIWLSLQLLLFFWGLAEPTSALLSL